MNRIYALRWNTTIRRWVVTSELARRTRPVAASGAGASARTVVGAALLSASLFAAGAPAAYAQDGTPGATFNGTTMNNAGTLMGGEPGTSANTGGWGAVIVGGGDEHRNSGTIVGGGSGIVNGNAGSGLSLSQNGTRLTNAASGRIIGANGGTGRSGGHGAVLTADDSETQTASIHNSGTVIGGNSGGAGQPGGNGIRGFNAYIANDGVISGGQNADGSRANAIAFTGGRNSLELRPGSVINGNVTAFSRADGLYLGGTGGAVGTFNVAEIGDAAKYRGFGVFLVPATNWTLTGTTTAVTPWQVLVGSLAASADGALGASTGALSLMSNGTLRVLGDTFTSTARQISLQVGGGAFDIASPTNTFTISQALTGDGQRVAKRGPGTLVYTGNNTYTGGTTIEAGTLRLGNGGTTGGVVGNIVNNGALVIDRSNAYTLGGGMSGTGSLTQAGTGTTTVTAAQTYTGGTTISAGTLQLGNGGTAGSVVGDIVNNAALVVNRSNAVTLGGAISGSGTVTQSGAGTTTLTGANRYTGATNITAGTLLINGDQRLAAGATSVASGAVLGGAGVIGGDVAIAGGATLAPGATAGIPGTLTIAGDLSLASASTLNYQFGQAGTVGGPLNDLTVVDGDLVLDGTLNASASPGGTFGGGLYRVISYSGSLTDNGLDLGTMLDPVRFNVQTSVANQVNLVNAAGLSLNFWDGDAGGRNDGTISGGNGTWQARTPRGRDSWTDRDGAINALYTDGAFAIFAGTAGTVDVENAVGGVTTSGLQFATDGYVVQGDALTLVDDGTGSATLRVGDGTTAGADYTATIDAVLQGGTAVTKTDAGTLVLGADNTYTGGTTIEGGTLQLGHGGTTGSVLGDIASDGALVINRSNAATMAGTISGTGEVTQAGTGTTTFTADNTYAGGTTISAGTLQLGNGGTTGGLVGDVVNNSALIVNRSNAVALAGTISGSGKVTQAGTGTTTLIADNTYTGGTTISGGTLQLGNGGTTGGVAGNIVNDGALVIDRSNAVTMAGVISGSGTVTQDGTGTTTLTGANSYTGATTVSSGTLLVNGDQRAATGVTSVASGASLGGAGTIGGDVAIAGGAILAPGASTGAPGTLIIAGDLSLADGAVLDYQFGQAGVVGGPLNDLTLVEGDLVLDGTLNVTQSPGGTFGGGLYRVIGYNGALTNNGLALGADLDPATFSVQTSVANQVNLVNTAGLSLNFWDGEAGGRNDGTITGGDGTWQARAPGGNDNWTDADGSINATYSDGAFAIFAGTGGTVDVDNSAGAVTASGMQFAADGYVVQGDAITLVDDAADGTVIRVGDGTTAGANFTATIDAVLQGDTDLVKADAGTLVLGGANTYTGGTTIAGGTLRAAMTEAFSASSRHAVAQGGTLDLAGYDQTVGGLHNAGTVSLMGATPGTTLTVRGGYVGDGGVLRMSAALGDSSSPTDRLVIDGGAVSGRTLIDLTNRDGLGAQTTGDGIEMVRAINGATTTAQTTKDGFSLVGDYVDAGAFEYRLYAADAAGLGENWYLRSSNRGETPLFASLSGQLRESSLGMLGNLHQRLGDATMGSGSESSGYRQSWGRLVSIDRSLKQGGDATPSSRGRQNGLQIGSDVWVGGNWHVGAYFGTLAGEMQVEGSARGSTNLPVGRTDLDSRFVGLYGTFEAENGFYVDTVLQGGRLRYKLIPTIGDMVSGDGDSRVASVEIGQAFPIGRYWQLEPQLQLAYQRLDNDDVEIANALVQQDAANSLTARVGLRLKGAFETGAGLLQPYTRVNYYRTRSDQDVARFIGPSATADIVTPTSGRSSELAMGMTLSVNREVSLFGEVGKLWAHGDQSRTRSDDLSADVGVKVGW